MGAEGTVVSIVTPADVFVVEKLSKKLGVPILVGGPCRRWMALSAQQPRARLALAGCPRAASPRGRRNPACGGPPLCAAGRVVAGSCRAVRGRLARATIRRSR
jgi:hypothetical protein